MTIAEVYALLTALPLYAVRMDPMGDAPIPRLEYALGMEGDRQVIRLKALSRDPNEADAMVERAEAAFSARGFDPAVSRPPALLNSGLYQREAALYLVYPTAALTINGNVCGCSHCRLHIQRRDRLRQQADGSFAVLSLPPLTTLQLKTRETDAAACALLRQSGLEGIRLDVGYQGKTFTGKVLRLLEKNGCLEVTVQMEQAG